jgi:replication factor C subunit 2/4
MDLSEPVKLEYIREIGFTHMRIAEGLNTKLQLLRCTGCLCLQRPQQ